MIKESQLHLLQRMHIFNINGTQWHVGTEIIYHDCVYGSRSMPLVY